MDSIKNIKLLIFSCTFFVGAAVAQQSSTLKIYNKQNGLIDNSVRSLTLDSDKFLWVATDMGLTRFNGTKLKTFLLDSNHNLYHLSNDVFSLSNYKHVQNTFVKVKTGSVYLIKNAEPILYKETNDSISHADFFLGHYPNLDLYTKFNLVNEGLEIKKKWFRGIVQLLPINSTDFIIRDKDSRNVFYYENGINKFKIKLDFPFMQFAKSGDANFLIDSNNDLHIYDPEKKKFEKRNSFVSGKKIVGHHDQIFLWDTFNDEAYCYSDKIFYSIHYDYLNQRFDFIPEFSTEAEGFLWTCILHDKVDDLYFLGTINEGLCVFKKKNISVFRGIIPKAAKKDIIPSINMSVLKLNDSTVLFSSGVMIQKRGGRTLFKKAGNLYSYPKTIGKLGNIGVLCADNSSLYYYLHADGYKKRYSYNSDFNHTNRERIELIHPEGDSVWVGTYNSLYCVTKNKSSIIFTTKAMEENAPFYGLSNIHRPNKKELWLSGWMGVHKINTISPFAISEIAELKGKLVLDISSYKNYLIISVYKEGIYVYDGKLFKKIPVFQKKSELFSCISTYIDAKTDFLWVVTDRGLFKTSMQSVLAFINNSTTVPFFYFYGETDGMKDAEFSGIGMPSFAVLENKEFFLPTMNGFAVVESDKLTDKIESSPLLIESVSYNGRMGHTINSDSILLEPGIDVVNIELNTSHFGDIENLNLEYSYDGLDWKRIDVGIGQTFSISQIKYGTKQLQIRKRIGFGENDFLYRTLVIIKGKRYYEQWWFYLLCTVAFIFLFLLFAQIYSYRINKNRKKLQKLVDEQTTELSRTVEVKELLINIISHDMVTPLKYISLISGILENGLERDLKKSKTALSDIKKTAENLLLNSSSIINWMKYNNRRIEVVKNNIDLFSTVNQMCAYFNLLANEKKIKIINEIHRPTFVDMDLNVFNIILNNLISNAIRYSESTEIRIRSESNEKSNRIKIMVADKGIGMNEDLIFLLNELLKGNIKAINSGEKKSTGLGYVLIGELAKVHNMEIKLISQLGNGTSVSIEMDLINYM